MQVKIYKIMLRYIEITVWSPWKIEPPSLFTNFFQKGTRVLAISLANQNLVLWSRENAGEQSNNPFALAFV